MFGQTDSQRREILYIDLGGIIAPTGEEIHFICAKTIRGLGIPLASVQFRITGYPGAYGSRLDLDKLAFLDLVEAEEQARQGSFDEAAPRVAELIRLRF